MSAQAAPPKHHMAFMIWLSVFPTLAVLELLLRPLLAHLPIVLRLLILTAIVVPLVVYLVLPRVQRGRALLLRRRDGRGDDGRGGGSAPTQRNRHAG
ncbi:hypothetical protein ABZO31_01170 [Streptomyces sp. HUAS MG47]|uniref:hypothetical protein n=1 Tax=Streptomyces solicamelliae TaxID=3231716 RepID=UPI003877C0BF